jgi:two-component SAPR family response regulator
MRKFRSVIIIEREAIVALDLRNLLLKNNFKPVDIIKNFSEIFERLRTGRPDLIIIDSAEITHPEKVSLLTDLFDIPVLLLSDLPESDLKKFQLSGCSYIRKPYQKKELVTLLGKTSEYII